MRVEELLEEWTAHYLGGMGFRLYRVELEGEGARFFLGWRGKEVVRAFYLPMGEGKGACLRVEYTPGTLPRGVEEGLFKVMRVLIPPGGRIVLRAEVRELEEYLRRGVPLILTPWGLLVWLAGARDLSWSEDGVEGKVPLVRKEEEGEMEELRAFVEAHRDSRDPYILRALENWETVEWEAHDDQGD